MLKHKWASVIETTLWLKHWLRKLFITCRANGTWVWFLPNKKLYFFAIYFWGTTMLLKLCRWSYSYILWGFVGRLYQLSSSIRLTLTCQVCYKACQRRYLGLTRFSCLFASKMISNNAETSQRDCVHHSFMGTESEWLPWSVTGTTSNEVLNL